MSLFDEMTTCLARLREAGVRLEAALCNSEELSEFEVQQAWVQPRFRIGDAACLAGMHPQTLRQYDRLGLVVPGRTGGGGRRYSLRDLSHLRQIQVLSQEEGVNLEGIRRIMDLQRRVEELEQENTQLALAAKLSNRVFAASSAGEVTSLSWGQRAEKSQSVGFPVSRSSALVLWQK